jgi:hypothetical protein
MMSAHQIRLAICERLKAIDGSCNQTHITHNEGVFRGLVWALTGKDPGTDLLVNTETLLKLVGIPCSRDGDTVKWDLE